MQCGAFRKLFLNVFISLYLGILLMFNPMFIYDCVLFSFIVFILHSSLLALNKGNVSFVHCPCLNKVTLLDIVEQFANANRPKVFAQT